MAASPPFLLAPAPQPTKAMPNNSYAHFNIRIPILLNENLSMPCPTFQNPIPMEMGMAPELQPDVCGGGQEKFQMTNFLMPNNTSLMENVLKSFPGLADVRAPHGVEDGPRTLAPGSGSKMYAYHVDQHEKLKGLGRSKAT